MQPRKVVLLGVFLIVGATGGCSDDGDSGGNTNNGGSSAAGGGGSGGSSAASAGGVGGGAAGTGASAGGTGGGGAGGSAASTSSGGVGGGSTGTGGSGTSGTGGTSAGGCRPVDVPCGDPGATCCAGSECVEATPDPLCLIPCEADTDCESGCCLEYGNIRRKVCGTAAECASCAAVGQPCAQSACCGGSICATIENVQACRKECTVASECATNCCVPLANVSKLVCLDAKYCP